jgi:hypothetical protein
MTRIWAFPASDAIIGITMRECRRAVAVPILISNCVRSRTGNVTGFRIKGPWRRTIMAVVVVVIIVIGILRIIIWIFGIVMAISPIFLAVLPGISGVIILDSFRARLCRIRTQAKRKTDEEKGENKGNLHL